jgi:hypothetical protein
MLALGAMAVKLVLTMGAKTPADDSTDTVLSPSLAPALYQQRP